MKRCIIISAGELGRLTRQEIAPAPGDYIIACDAGILHAQALGITPDAVLTDVEGAMAALGELTGRSVREDVVERIFARFCVGK